MTEQVPQVDGCIVIPEGFPEPRYAPRSSNTKRKSRVGGRYFTELPIPDLNRDDLVAGRGGTLP